MISEAQVWIDADKRPPLLTVRDGGVDVPMRRDLWPADVRNYRGRGRFERIRE